MWERVQSLLTLCNPMDCSPPGSSIHGLLQTGTLEWVAISSSRGSSQRKDRTQVLSASGIGQQTLYRCSTWEALSHLFAAAAKSLQSCPTLCDPIDSSPPSYTLPGILQARTLEWVAISFSNAWKWRVKVKSLSRVRLDPMDRSLPGSSVHQIFQARVLERGAIAFSHTFLLRV